MPIITVEIYRGNIKRKRQISQGNYRRCSQDTRIKKKDIIVVSQEDPHGNWYSSGIRPY